VSGRFLVCLAITCAVALSGNYLYRRWTIAQIPVFHQIGDGVHPQLGPKSHAGDDDPNRNALRNAALNAALELKNAPCSATAKERYVQAVIAYIRPRFDVAPCLATETCRQSDEGKVSVSTKDFRTELDKRVSEAMDEAHTHTGFQIYDFPRDTVRIVASMSHDSNLYSDLPPQRRRGALSGPCD
jgi:hypothetical protein